MRVTSGSRGLGPSASTASQAQLLLQLLGLNVLTASKYIALGIAFAAQLV